MAAIGHTFSFEQLEYHTPSRALDLPFEKEKKLRKDSCLFIAALGKICDMYAFLFVISFCCVVGVLLLHLRRGLIVFLSFRCVGVFASAMPSLAKSRNKCFCVFCAHLACGVL